ncbi:MAG TPA: hypothetical protein VGG34_05100 [Opitutaceae bacterium]|jgi:hypothetical protein
MRTKGFDFKQLSGADSISAGIFGNIAGTPAAKFIRSKRKEGLTDGQILDAVSEFIECDDGPSEEANQLRRKYASQGRAVNIREMKSNLVYVIRRDVLLYFIAEFDAKWEQIGNVHPAFAQTALFVQICTSTCSVGRKPKSKNEIEEDFFWKSRGSKGPIADWPPFKPSASLTLDFLNHTMPSDAALPDHRTVERWIKRISPTINHRVTPRRN